MTKAHFYKADSRFTGFKIKGHAGLSLETPDVLCAAVSSMTLLVINTVTDVFGCEVDFKQDEEEPSISLDILSCPSENSGAVDGVLKGFLLQLEDLSEQYPKNLYVEVHKNTTKGTKNHD